MDTNQTPPEKVEVPAEPVPVETAPATVLTEESVAESYIADELIKARSALQRTMIISLLLIVAVGGYMGYIAYNFQQNLQPAAAAEIAAGVIDERVEIHGAEVAQELKERVPALIAELPDYVIRELPTYRAALEDQIETDLTRHSEDISAQLGTHMDEFLEEHKTEIKDLLAAGQDKESVEQLGADLETEFMKWLKEEPAGGGETITQKIDQSLVALRDIEKKMAHLAANQNITPQEKKTRRAIAILGKTVEREVTPLKADFDDLTTKAAAATTRVMPENEEGTTSP